VLDFSCFTFGHGNDLGLDWPVNHSGFTLISHANGHENLNRILTDQSRAGWRILPGLWMSGQFFQAMTAKSADASNAEVGFAD
jgi:hypothetical protein